MRRDCSRSLRSLRAAFCTSRRALQTSGAPVVDRCADCLVADENDRLVAARAAWGQKETRQHESAARRVATAQAFGAAMAAAGNPGAQRFATDWKNSRITERSLTGWLLGEPFLHVESDTWSHHLQPGVFTNGTVGVAIDQAESYRSSLIALRMPPGLGEGNDPMSALSVSERWHYRKLLREGIKFRSTTAFAVLDREQPGFNNVEGRLCQLASKHGVTF